MSENNTKEVIENNEVNEVVNNTDSNLENQELKEDINESEVIEESKEETSEEEIIETPDDIKLNLYFVFKPFDFVYKDKQADEKGLYICKEGSHEEEVCRLKGGFEVSHYIRELGFVSPEGVEEAIGAVLEKAEALKTENEELKNKFNEQKERADKSELDRGKENLANKELIEKLKTENKELKEKLANKKSEGDKTKIKVEEKVETKKETAKKTTPKTKTNNTNTK